MKDNKKNEIREIALNLFRNHTYDSVSVNRIAKEAGISKNTFYYYFSKYLSQNFYLMMRL